MTRPSFALTAFLLAASALAQDDQAFKSGPAVGEKLPNFTVETHKGVSTSLQQLTGPNGLYLVVHRSADW